MRSRFLFTLMLGLCVVSCGSLAAAAFGAEPEKYALEEASAELSTYQAGAHADFITTFRLTEENGAPYALTRDIEVAVPPGLIGNPQNLPRCTELQLGTEPSESECPVDSQVGVTSVTLGGEGSPATFKEPIYMMQPPGGDIVARLGFFAALYPTFINVRVDPIDYSLTAAIEGAPAAAELIGARTTLWGVPAADVHDGERLTPQEAVEFKTPPDRPAGLPAKPFMTNPTSCAGPQELSVTARSYQLPGSPSTLTAMMPGIVGCGKVSFQPNLSVVATSAAAATATGVQAKLVIPQDETPDGRGTSALKSARVTLPPGVTINPAAGDGLAGCSPAQVGFGSPAPPACPNASKIGTAEIVVPALERPLQAAVYQRTPEPGHLFQLWLVADEQGVRLKLPAEIIANPVTGQLQTVFDGLSSLGGNPQVPIASIDLRVFDGPRAPLSTPSTCGVYQTRYELEPWSGLAPTIGETPMEISSDCGKGGFAPRLTAGTLDPSAGKYSPFVLQLFRNDGEANPLSIDVTLPEGLIGKLAGVPLCPESAAPLAACPPDSQIGSAATAAGVGSAPLWIPQPGKAPTAAFLAGPYKGAPYSLVVRVPAQAGPFDLGTVVVRSAIFVDPETTQVTVKADPLPQILEGVPIAYRAIYVLVDRPQFILNPTDCDSKQIRASLIAVGGLVAQPSAGFQATNCAKLPFAPKLQMSLKGGTKRSGHPAARAVLTPRKGDANPARVSAILPHSQFIDQDHINNPCTRDEFSKGECKKSAILGRARAFSPLIDQPLEGLIYFRSNGGVRELPDIVVDVRGQGIRVTQVGFVDSVNARVRVRFQNFPDVPVSKAILSFKGGKDGLLENSENLCRKPQVAAVKLNGQNGKVVSRAQRINVISCSKRK